MTEFTFISDPGHAWLEVNLTEFPEAVNYGTGFGYLNGNCIYLEQDVEAESFLNHLMSQGEPISFSEVNFDEEWVGRNYRHNEIGIHHKK